MDRSLMGRIPEVMKPIKFDTKLDVMKMENESLFKRVVF